MVDCTGVVLGCKIEQRENNRGRWGESGYGYAARGHRRQAASLFAAHRLHRRGRISPGEQHRGPFPAGGGENIFLAYTLLNRV